MATAYVCILIILVNCSHLPLDITINSFLIVYFLSVFIYSTSYVKKKKKKDNSYNRRKDLNETNHEWNLEKLKL